MAQLNKLAFSIHGNASAPDTTIAWLYGTL